MFRHLPIVAAALAVALSVPAAAAPFGIPSQSPAASAPLVESAQLRKQQRQRIVRPLPPSPCRKTVCPR